MRICVWVLIWISFLAGCTTNKVYQGCDSQYREKKVYTDLIKVRCDDGRAGYAEVKK